MRGKFITIYGINNIGKTTHSLRLVKKLKEMGVPAVYIKYPIYSQKPTGPLLNKILRRKSRQVISEEELQLWFVLNRYQFEPTLKRMLKKGKVIIAEDYIGTGIAWGTSKGANQRELENMNKYLVQPDLSILMDGKRVMTAKEKKHLHEKNDKLVDKCQLVFRSLARKNKWKTFNISENREITSERLWRIVADFLNLKKQIS